MGKIMVFELELDLHGGIYLRMDPRETTALYREVGAETKSRERPVGFNR